MLKFVFVFLLVGLAATMTPTELDTKLKAFVNSSQLMGIAVQITKSSTTIYRGNFGFRDYQRQLPINNDTSFRVASLSKSMAAVGLMLLVEQGKLKLTDSISSVAGFDIINPNFPTKQITVEMVLTHQSSILDCSAFDTFTVDTDLAANIS